MKRILALTFIFVACASSVPTTDKKAELRGIVMKIDAAEMLIYLAPPVSERSNIPPIRYNSLTIVDRLSRPGRVEDIHPGEEIMVFGRETEEGEVIAYRIVIDTPQSTFPR
ncbi:MAG TPA: hypothetical protein VNA69_24270 [Thermoanaerobaculia bacterium]|nr:hypothetical protein [Thermoanaerobaculia bacterium]